MKSPAKVNKLSLLEIIFTITIVITVNVCLLAGIIVMENPPPAFTRFRAQLNQVVAGEPDGCILEMLCPLPENPHE